MTRRKRYNTYGNKCSDRPDEPDYLRQEEMACNPCPKGYLNGENCRKCEVTQEEKFAMEESCDYKEDATRDEE